MTRLRNILVILAGVLLLSACSNVSYLKPGQVLYTGAKVDINPDEPKIPREKQFKEELNDRTRPIPNKKLLGLRYKLWFYNIAGEVKKQKGPLYWLKYKLGEPPVLLGEVDIPRNSMVLQSYMISKGFLQTEVEGITEVKGKKGTANYTVYTGNRYKVKNYEYPNDTTSELIRNILAQQDKRLINPGDFYDLDRIKDERGRIDAGMKERGYFFFSPDYLIMQADSNIGNHEINLYLKVKDDVPAAAMKPYYIRDIYIFPNFSLEKDTVIRPATVKMHKDYMVIDPLETYKPELFERLMFFENGEPYNRRDHELSLSRLVNIGTFKYVKADFTPVDTFASNEMDVSFILTSLKRKSLTAGLTGTTKSNDLIGSELRFSHLNRNLRFGAENLTTSLTAGFEQQIGERLENASAYSLGIDSRLVFPRFVLPIFKFDFYNAYVPKTHVTAGAQMMHRSLYYTLVSGKGEFGYIWKGNVFSEHMFNPLSVNYIRTLRTTDLFKRMLDQVPTLETNFENQFIIGTTYNLNYNDIFDLEKRNNVFLNLGVESAGNLASLVVPKRDDGKKYLFSIPINQFLRGNADFRNYYKLIKPNVSVFAARLNVGVGYPYGNSRTLPYIKQFFAGGTNDIRAFRARSLGPGSYNLNADSVLLFADQGGEIKFLTSLEYRRKIVGMFHGALFTDIGNIWLTRDDPQRPGGKFEFNKAWKELAVGAGIGLRLDARVFVARFDLATPLRKPYRPEGQRWVFDEFDLSDKYWRRRNLILNIGIGYPF